MTLTVSGIESSSRFFRSCSRIRFISFVTEIMIFSIGMRIHYPMVVIGSFINVLVAIPLGRCGYLMVVDEREERGRTIAETSGQIKREDDHTYVVKSQSGHGVYTVHLDPVSGWRCSCPDHMYREVKCKHLWACELSSRLREQAKKNLVIEPVTMSECPFCRSSDFKRFGIRHNRYGNIQRFICASCKRTFSLNLGFERMKHNPQAITSAMQLYFSGESLRNVAKSLRLLGAQVSHQTVYNWISRYTRVMQDYLDQVTPQLSDTWRADEVFLKIKGNPKYLYALLDDESRFWIAKTVAGDKLKREAIEYASELFRTGRQVAGKKPHVLITDGLKAYHSAYKREFHSYASPHTHHIQHVTWRKGCQDNRKMESFNGNTIRAREKCMRSLKREDSPILTGMQIFHNYVRPHKALDGESPCERAGITVQGENRWLTLIQNGAAHQPKVCRSKPQSTT